MRWGVWRFMDVSARWFVFGCVCVHVCESVSKRMWCTDNEDPRAAEYLKWPWTSVFSIPMAAGTVSAFVSICVCTCVCVGGGVWGGVTHVSMLYCIYILYFSHTFSFLKLQHRTNLYRWSYIIDILEYSDFRLTLWLWCTFICARCWLLVHSVLSLQMMATYCTLSPLCTQTTGRYEFSWSEYGSKTQPCLSQSAHIHRGTCEHWWRGLAG